MTPELRQARIDAAVAAARSARAVLVFVHEEGTEGADRPSLSLPLEQNGLIAAVVSAKPRTTVVLNSGYPVVMPQRPRDLAR